MDKLEIQLQNAQRQGNNENDVILWTDVGSNAGSNAEALT